MSTLAIPVDAIPEDAIDATPREVDGDVYEHDAAAVADVEPGSCAAAAQLAAEAVRAAAAPRGAM